MTPFGARIRQLRNLKGIPQKKMAEELQISSAYLSALEHGKRGRPAPGFVMQVANYFGLIWDDVDNLKLLAKLSHPKIRVDTSGLSPQATLLANLLAIHINELDDFTIKRILSEMGFDKEI